MDGGFEFREVWGLGRQSWVFSCRRVIQGGGEVEVEFRGVFAIEDYNVNLQLF